MEFYAGYLAKYMFLKKWRAFKLDATAEFFKQAGIIYSGNDDLNEYDESDRGDDDDNEQDRGGDDDDDGDRGSGSDDDDAPGYSFF